MFPRLLGEPRPFASGTLARSEVPVVKTGMGVVEVLWDF